jgi:preprotein translocase subunit YajC
MDNQSGAVSGDALKPGDWVRTASGHIGKILLIARLSAFIEIKGHDELRTQPFLVSELTKVDRNGGAKDNEPSSP